MSTLEDLLLDGDDDWLVDTCEEGAAYPCRLIVLLTIERRRG